MLNRKQPVLRVRSNNHTKFIESEVETLFKNNLKHEAKESHARREVLSENLAGNK